VFFAVCAGELRPVPPSGTGIAGSFPLGCYERGTGRRLGAESFVPGFTQVYVFADGRTNELPVVEGLTLDGAPLPEDFAEIPTVPTCHLPREERRTTGCGAPVLEDECEGYELEVVVPSNVAEVDPDATGIDGEPQTEVVWVDYYADLGDLSGATKLVNDAKEGYLAEHEATWYPPAEPGLATLWAVVHDARGGTSIVQRFVRVE
jgi:hypothetical protein